MPSPSPHTSLFETIIDRSDEAAILFDTNAEILRVNAPFTALFGYTLEELKGKKSSDTFGRHFGAEVHLLTQNILQGKITTVDTVRHHKDGTPINVSILSFPVVSGSDFVGMCAVFRDISESKRAEINLHRERNLLRAILESIPDEVYVKDKEGRFLLANSACAAALASVGITSPEELIGKTDLDLFPEELARSEFDEEQKMLRSGKPIIDKEQTTRDPLSGTVIRSLMISKIPLRDPQGNIVGLVGTNRDVTAMASVREALKISEEKYRTIFENVQDVFYQTDLTGTIIDISPSIERYSRYPREELIGKPVETVYLNPSDRKALMKMLLDKGEVVDIQIPLRTKDNLIVPTSINAHLLFDDNGRPTGVEGSLRNLTERIKAENSLRETSSRLSTLIQNLHSGILVINEEGKILLANEQFRRIFAIDSSLPEILSMESDELQTAVGSVVPDRERFNERIAEILLWREPVVREEFVLNNGTILERDYVPIVVEGEYKGHLWQFHDVTESRKAQDILARYAEDLYRAKQQTEQQNTALERQSHELIDAREAALQASKLKSEFVANMSHEIRTPMNGVLSIAELLRETELTKEQKDYVGIIINSGESLLKIINDILDFSKIEAGKLTIEETEFDLASVVDETVTLLAYKANEKRIELISHIYNDVPTLLRGDPVRIRQIITNFVGNAVKFTEQGEVIVRVTLERRTERGVVLRFSISDTGIGIPQDIQKKLFQPFTQADGSTTRKYGGTGLGLTISKQLVDMMHGTVGLDSEPGKGSTFWFTVPFEVQSADRTTPTRPLPSLPVLIVDDNDTNRMMLMQYCASWGLRPDEANDAASALVLIDHRKTTGDQYRLVVLDMQMPGMNGLQLAMNIRRSVNGEMKILMASSMKVPADQWHGAGIDQFLLKPIRKNELYSTLVSLFGGDTAGLPVPSVSPQPLSLNSMKILIAEDNPVNQKVAVKMLERLGVVPDVVSSGKEAVDAVRNVHYDIVLMDVQMPEMDGLEATRTIRALEKDKRHTTIIAMTANALQGDRERCLQAGMDDYLSKPVKQQELRGMLEKWGVGTVSGAARAAVHTDPSVMIDPARIAEMREIGDEALLTELLTIFLDDTGSTLREMKTAFDGKDAKHLRECSHKIKGSSANLGILSIRRISAVIEEHAKNERIAEARPAYEELAAEFVKVKAHIESEYLRV